jgi:hypothetical protein
MMSAQFVAQQQYLRYSMAFRARVAALCAAWTIYTLKRASADVASMTDWDYRDFGLDKDDMLRVLRQLRYGLEGPILRPRSRSH